MSGSDVKEICKEFYRFSGNKETLKLIINSYSEIWFDRYRVAGNSSAPIYILKKLSNDEFSSVCYQAAQTLNRLFN